MQVRSLRKAHLVLGGEEEYEHLLATAAATSDGPECHEPAETVDDVRPDSLPADLMQAAQVAPDRGVALIRAYRTLAAHQCGPTAGTACKPTAKHRT